MQPLYEVVIERLGAGPGFHLLDAGCGSGLALSIAAERGAKVAGADATPELLEIARARVPAADLRHADLEELPFAEGTFDAVTGFNAFQYAAHPGAAVAEAARVTRRGGHVVAAVWGTPEETEASGYIRALGSQMPPPPPDAPGPFALSADGALGALLEGAGLELAGVDSVSCPWEYPDEATALRGLLSAGPAIRAIDHAGEDAVIRAVREALAPFRRPSGAYVMQNRFRYAIGKVV